MSNIERGKIIQDARKRMGLTPAKLASIVNVSRISVMNWERGLSLKADHLERLAAALNLDIHTLQTGEATKKTTVCKNNIESGIIATFPLLKAEQVEEWIQNPVIVNKHAMLNMPIKDKKYGKDVFLFEIIGKSMINKDNLIESLVPNELVIVDPAIAPKDGQLVLARFGKDDLRARQYREDGAFKFLQAFDQEIKSTPLGDEVSIVGTIVGSYRDRS